MYYFYILLESISGYIFLVPGLLVYFWYLKRSGKPQTIPHIALTYLFWYYIMGILLVTGITTPRKFTPTIEMIPFVDMLRAPVGTILNVLLFFPLGVFLPMLYRQYHRLKSVAWTGFLLSLSIELLQMFSIRATDINDLMTNIAGACLGYWTYRAVANRLPQKTKEKLQARKIVHAEREVLLFMVYAFVVMMTLQPLVVYAIL